MECKKACMSWWAGLIESGPSVLNFVFIMLLVSDVVVVKLASVWMRFPVLSSGLEG